MMPLVFHESPFPLADCSSWILVHLSEVHPTLIRPFYNGFVDALLETTHVAVLRNVRTLQHLHIQDHRERVMLDRLLRFV